MKLGHWRVFPSGQECSRSVWGVLVSLLGCGAEDSEAEEVVGVGGRWEGPGFGGKAGLGGVAEGRLAVGGKPMAEIEGSVDD